MDKILIVRLSSLGDIVHSIPFAAALRSRFPEAHIDWLVEAQHTAILDLAPVINRRIEIDIYNPRSIITSIKRLRSMHYDCAFDVQGLIKSAVLARASGATRVIGFSKDHLGEKAAHVFYTESIDPGEQAHVINKNLGLLRAIGVQTASLFSGVHVGLQISFKRNSMRAITGSTFAVLNPGASWLHKRWPPERFGELAIRIKKECALETIVTRGERDTGIAQAVVAASHGTATLAPPTTLNDLAAIIGQAALVVSGDTGPLHIAAAMGTPVVGLYGPTNPTRNGPWSPLDVCVSRFEACTCKYQRRCHAPIPCIESISVNEVAEAIGHRLQKIRAHYPA